MTDREAATSSDASAAELFAGGGEVRALARQLDWAATPLGSPSTWSPAMRTMVRAMYDTPFPVCLWAGPQYALVYNDPYRRILAAKHPWALGRPGSEVWAEIWEGLESQFEQVRQGGDPVYFEDAPFVMARLEGGGTENAWFSYSLSALRDESGNVAAVLNISPETTGRVLAERRVRETNETLELMLANTHIVGLYDWLIPEDRVYADARFARLYAVDPKEAETGAPLSAFIAAIHPEDRVRVQAEIEATIKDASPYASEYRLRAPDGTISHVMARGRCRTDEAGKPLRFSGAVIDITAQKSAEEDLRNLNADLERQVIERSSERGTTWQLSPHLMSVLNLETAAFARVNPAWTVTLGWSEDELTGKPYYNFIHPDDITASRAAWDEARDGNAVLNFENRYLTKSGEVRWLSWVAVPENGNLYSTARDVTKEKEQAALVNLRTLERDRLWNASEDFLVIADYEGKLIRVSPSWITQLGHSEATLLSEDYNRLNHPEDLLRVQSAVETMRQTGKPAKFEGRIRAADGKWRRVSWTLSPDPGHNQFSGVGRDVTELKETEEALRQSQKMEAVGQLTGGIAHDFNNLLAAISGCLEFVERRISSGRLADTTRYIDGAQDATRRAAALTQRLLAFSRRQTLDPKPTDVNRLINGLEELIRRSVGPNITVEVVGAGGLWPTKVDPSQLENSVLNLCVNARDAMAASGGRLTIETANKWLDERSAKERDLAPGQYVSLCVTDTGTGMDAEVISHVFEPFFTTKPIGSGTGLGLSMVYGFARQSGGQIRIYSEVGKGTTMCLYLPRFVGEVENVDQETAPSLTSGAGETVLVIDDEATVRMLVAEILEESGYQTLEAGDGPSGLKILQSDARVDLLITDVGLPGGMNGRQIADAARVLRPNLKVIFITGYAENAAIGNGDLDSGMEIITKPFAITTLANKVRELLLSA